MNTPSDLPGDSASSMHAKSTAKAEKKDRNAIHSSHRVSPTDPSELMDHASSLWLAGDWQQLIQIGKGGTNHDGADYRLPLLLASAHAQAGDFSVASHLLQQAVEAGCEKKHMAGILLSGAYNSIGRATAVAGPMDKGLRHFIMAIAAGMPEADTDIWAKTRNIEQLKQLGLLSDADQELHKISALALLEKIGDGNMATPAETSTAIDSAALSYYQNLDGFGKGDPPPFVLIDSKSMPRSGLHYLKNTLTRLLGEHFSFCEWYQEAGCCKHRPCALTGFACYAQQSGSCRIRLIKSHDFQHNDPLLETGPHLLRLILIRDPLYVLTSWFELEELARYKEVLSKHAIGMPKIWLSHEKEVLNAAYSILDDCFEPPTVDQLASWLVTKSEYIITFLCRWALPAIERPTPNTHLVKYEEIDRFVLQLIEPHIHTLSDTARISITEHAANGGSSFKKRKGPYSAKSTVVSSYLSRHSELFEDASARIKALFPQHVSVLFDS
jgi:hypothetical protein